MEFKINGKKVIPNKSVNPEFVRKKLNGLKEGELLTTPNLSDFLGVSGGYVRDFVAKKLPSNCFLSGGRWVWGSEKTIKAYRAVLDE